MGVVMVKTLQNTKYSINEKLDQSFINLFSKKPSILSDAQGHANDNRDTEADGLELDDDSGGLEMDGSDSSGEIIAGQEDATISSKDYVSDKESDDVLKQKKIFTEHLEFHGGRMRRKALFGDENSDMKVTGIICTLF